MLPHVMIDTDSNGLVNVSIEDYELFDYIDDFLTEKCSVQYEYKSESKNTKGAVYIMHFSSNYNVTEIQQYLLKLKPEALEKIYSINN